MHNFVRWSIYQLNPRCKVYESFFFFAYVPLLFYSQQSTSSPYFVPMDRGFEPAPAGTSPRTLNLACIFMFFPYPPPPIPVALEKNSSSSLKPCFVHLERFPPVFSVILTTLLCSITAKTKSLEILQGFKLGYQPIMITNKGSSNNYRRG